MTEPRDIADRADIDSLLTAFYAAARVDALLGPVFGAAIAPDAWPEHLRHIGDFWETVLLQTTRYSGAPIPVHFALDKQTALEAVHFDQWLRLFCLTTDRLFAGAIAEEVKKRARLMAPLMLYKIHAARGSGFVQ